MAYQTFGKQITALTGINLTASTNQGYVDSFLTNAARDILNMIPTQALANIGGMSVLDNSPTTLPDVDTKMILGVVRKYDNNNNTDSQMNDNSNTGRFRECRQISWRDAGIAENDSGYLESYSIEDPAYYIHNNTLYVLPVPDATYTAIVHHVSFPTVLYNETTINDFPNQLEQAVVYRAAADAARFLFQDEQDEEIYIPMVKDLTNQFTNSLNLFLSRYKKTEPMKSEEVSGEANLMNFLRKAVGGVK